MKLTQETYVKNTIFKTGQRFKKKNSHVMMQLCQKHLKKPHLQ